MRSVATVNGSPQARSGSVTSILPGCPASGSCAAGRTSMPARRHRESPWWPSPDRWRPARESPVQHRDLRPVARPGTRGQLGRAVAGRSLLDLQAQALGSVAVGRAVVAPFLTGDRPDDAVCGLMHQPGHQLSAGKGRSGLAIGTEVDFQDPGLVGPANRCAA